jgi:predicted chitinase
MRGAVENIPIIKQELIKAGIVNENLINGILATIGKESNYKPQSENLNYTASRIQQVWKYVKPDQAAKLANNPKALAEFVYGNKYGNPPGRAFDFRGRGLNQITFYNTYKKIGDQIGVNLIDNPDLLNRIDIAAKANAAFFKNVFNQNKANIKRIYGIDITSIPPGTDPLKLLKIAVNANAGFGKTSDIVNQEYQKALQYFKYNKGESNYFIPLILLAGLTYLFLKK